MKETSAELRKRDGRRMVAAALGACVGLSGIDHGIFEVLQGNTSTRGFLIPAIGPDQLLWEYGTEDAFTIVPNYLATGILAIALGALTLVWAVGFLDRPGSSRVLLGLGVLTFLVGGGVGMLAFLLPGWAIAARIGRPPRRPDRVPERVRAVMTRARPALVGTGLVLYLGAIQIAITGYVPGLSDADQILAVCWSLLGGALALFTVALVGAGVRVPERESAANDVITHQLPMAAGVR